MLGSLCNKICLLVLLLDRYFPYIRNCKFFFCRVITFQLNFFFFHFQLFIYSWNVIWSLLTYNAIFVFYPASFFEYCDVPTFTYLSISLSFSLLFQLNFMLCLWKFLIVFLTNVTGLWCWKKCSHKSDYCIFVFYPVNCFS